ncbi:MAG: polymerase sigma factor ylaC [Marmoricola sp.]|nr:polymerase sigma factor ylaC [Marmoricola sp.]
MFTMTDRTDLELLEEARGGNTGAFSELYCRHRPAMLGVARRLGGPGLAEDLVSESVTKIWLKLQQGEGPRTSFVGYASAAIRNEFFTEVRRAQRLSFVGDSEDWIQITDSAVVARIPSTETSVLHTLDETRIHRAIDALQPRWRHVLVRIYFDDASSEQVAAELGLQVNAIHQLAFRARRGLRRSLVNQPEPVDRSEWSRTISR